MIARSGLLLEDGHYKLVSRIAVGGMGEVWRSHDVLTNAPVAIKVLRPELTGDPTSLKRLRFEARNAAMLNHPNITQVLNYGELDGTGYIVMEYVEGRSLADALATHSTIAPLRLLPILIQAARGLHAAHIAGVVHRDVKPGNILLGHADHVKLTDFGISVAHGQLALTEDGKVMGTAQYLSPEQALGRAATPAGDLYSLGVIAYEALVGERPFRGVNYVAIALAQVNQPPPPLPGTVEKSLAKLVLRLMEKDPAKRPGSGEELAVELEQALEVHRELAGRLLATRRGDSGRTARPVETRRPPTAEQPKIDAPSLMPPAAPSTAPSPAVGQAPPEPAPEPGRRPPIFPPPRSQSRRLPPPQTPEVALELPTAPPVPPKEELLRAAEGQAAAEWTRDPGVRQPLPSRSAGNLPIPERSAAPQAAPLTSSPLDQAVPRHEVPAPEQTAQAAAEPADDAVLAAPGRLEPPGIGIGAASGFGEAGELGAGADDAAEAARTASSDGPETALSRLAAATARTRLGRGARPERFSLDWWMPVLVGIGLVLIILIGLLTTLTASSGADGPRRSDWLGLAAPGRSIMIVYEASPDGALEGKVRQWRT